MTETTLELIDYCLSFYGDSPNSLRYFDDWEQPPMTSSEILAVLPHVEEVYPKEIKNGIPVNVDSFVREVIRDFVLVARGVDARTEHFTSSQERDIFNQNQDAWRSELETLISENDMSHNEIMKAWNEIIAPSGIKPKWFGFLRR